MNYNKIISIILLFAISTLAYANNDNDKPEIGKPCPEFKLSHVTHYSKKQVSLSDFKGQWLFLDFWFTGCSSCIHSFPKVSALQAAFPGKVQFLLVGHTGINNSGGGRNIEQMFEKLRLKQNLDIAAAYDSTLAISWGITSMPHIVVVDPLGIVRSITGGGDMTKEKIQSLLNGEPASFALKEGVSLVSRPEFEVNLKGHDGSDFPKEKILNQSVLTKWNGEKFRMGYDLDQYATFPPDEFKKGFKLSGLSLEGLYSIAYLGKSYGYLKFWGEPLYGKVYPKPLLELQDSTLFEYDLNGKGLFNYSLLIPADKVTKENLMRYMQQDLERVFEFQAVVEERDMPVWKLVAKSGAEKRIKTKGGTRYYSAEDGTSIVTGFTVRNVSMKDYIMYVCYYLNEKEIHPFIEATDITYNIDLTIDADLTNLQDVKMALQKNGLDLVLSTKKMPVLVIRNSK